MTVINTNTAANLTANAMTQNQRAMNQTMERLSTGSRVNSAADDAAGLAIVAKMDAQVRGTNMAIKNANDAIAMIQTADGAAIEIDSMLQRMREIAIQSQNSTNTADDLTNLNKEFAQLATEIDRVATTTEFNDTKILNASAGGGSDTDGIFDFTITSNSDSISVDFGDFQTSGGAAVAGVQTMTIADADMQGTNATDEFVFTFTTGEVMILDADELAAGGNTDSRDITPAQFVAAFNTKNGLAAASGLAPAIELSVNGTLYSFTQEVAGTGVLQSFRHMTANGVLTELDNNSADSLTTTVVGGAASSSGVFGNNISDFKTAKTGHSGEAQKSTTITELDTAIDGLAAKRADFGAYINRLEYTVDNLTNVSQNTVAARSRIEDADYAAETTELARTQIIAQAATAMLSQANQQAQSVLALLK
ncbi:flagellin [Porticoccaceae bacterium]|nr:flagellin [Porticoccaceae bacterium]